MAIAFVLALVTHGDMPWWSIVGAAFFFLAGVVGSYRSVTSFMAVDGEELRAKCTLYSSLRCQVSDIKRLYLSNATAVFGMTRPWMLWVDLPFGQRKYLSDDVKRYAWLDVFRIARALNRGCEGPAMPYLAYVACGSRRLASERGTLAPGRGWALVQKLRGESATGKLILNGPSGESWIYLIRGRNLRLEEDWGRDVTPDMVTSARAYEFQRSALNDEEISMVLRALEDKWLGAPPSQGLERAGASR